MRYFFDVESPNGIVLDTEGDEFDSTDAAHGEALLAALMLVSLRSVTLGPLKGWVIILRDANHLTLAEIELVDLVSGGYEPRQ